jgi:alpha-1,6-mannosyltransferase
MTTADALARPLAARTASSVPLAAACGAAVLLGTAVAATYPAASPISPDHVGGDRAWSWLFLGALAGAFVLYAVGAFALKSRGVRLRLVLALAVVIQALPLLGPVLLSTDSYTYWARARVEAVHGENPYTTAPDAVPADVALDRMGRAWRDRPTGYGPAFTLLSEAHAAAVGESAAAAERVYRGVAFLSMLALVGLAAALARNRPFAAAFVGWNPLLAVHFAGGGHNDAAMMMLVLTALLLAARSHPRAAGVSWALAIFIKWVPVVLLPLRALEARRTGRRIDHVGFALTATAIAAVASWRYGPEWLRSFGNFSGQLARTTSTSLTRWFTAAGVPENVAVGLLIGVFVAGYAWLLWQAWRGRARLGLCMGLLVATTSWLVPWYTVWAVPLAAIEEDRAAQVLAVALSAYLLKAAVPL